MQPRKDFGGKRGGGRSRLPLYTADKTHHPDACQSASCEVTAFVPEGFRMKDLKPPSRESR